MAGGLWIALTDMKEISTYAGGLLFPPKEAVAKAMGVEISDIISTPRSHGLNVEKLLQGGTQFLKSTAWREYIRLAHADWQKADPVLAKVEKYFAEAKPDESVPEHVLQTLHAHAKRLNGLDKFTGHILSYLRSVEHRVSKLEEAILSAPRTTPAIKDEIEALRRTAGAVYGQIKALQEREA
jgi:hypothetical protein